MKALKYFFFDSSRLFYTNCQLFFPVLISCLLEFFSSHYTFCLHFAPLYMFLAPYTARNTIGTNLGNEDQDADIDNTGEYGWAGSLMSQYTPGEQRLEICTRA